MLNPTKTINNNRGIALLLVISVTTILIAAALEYNRRSRFTVMSSVAARDQLVLSQMASSGIHAAMALLAKDRAESNMDSLLEDWANPDKVKELLNDILFDEGELTVTISDEMGRIQINALVTFPESRNFNDSQRQILERYLNFLKDETVETPEDSQPPAIINSLKDWLDSGDDDAITGLSGAESAYYQDLSPSYRSRNGPVADIYDLLLVKGITPEIFYGNPDKPGMIDALTVYGMKPGAGTEFTFSGKININTAPLPVLVALMPSENPELAAAFYALREEMAADKSAPDFSNPAWYQNIAELSGMSLDANMLTTASDIFRIVSEAKVNDSKLIATAVVERRQNEKSGKWTCQILDWDTQ
ncbi:MAG: general secretion pathway protein GspK [Desulfobacterales bacterium]|nr:general secretion pathway protein GspK [Desulfobacterales bacterium]